MDAIEFATKKAVGEGESFVMLFQRNLTPWRARRMVHPLFADERIHFFGAAAFERKGRGDR